MLPEGLALEPGFSTGIIGLTVGRQGWIEVIGRRRDWVIGQAVTLIRNIMPNWCGTFLARLIRSNEPGPSISGPLRRGAEHVIEIEVAEEAAAMTEGSAMRQLSLAL